MARRGQVLTDGIRVSVVIPVRDDAELLTGCLVALRAQTIAPDEVIVVDNASSDASAAIASSAGARVVRCEQIGIPAASAAGYDAARGDVILRLDADCVPPPSWIADMIAVLDARPEADAVTGPARFIDGPMLLRRPAVLLYLGAYTLATGLALGHRPLFGSNMAFRREAWLRVRDEVHRDDSEIHDDLDLAFHLGRAGRIVPLRGAPMGMSMRPLWSRRTFALRMRRGMRSVRMHWPDDFPPRRWAQVRRHRLGS